MSNDWSAVENEAIVSDYFAMFVKELRGEAVNKAEHNRNLRSFLLPKRSKNAVEYKHQNISAVLFELGYDYLDGYRPYFNVQASLRDAVRAQVMVRPEVARLITRIVRKPASTEPMNDREITLAPVPPTREDATAARKRLGKGTTPRTVDFGALEARNRSLGMAGEYAVLAFEHRRLWKAGHRKLAGRIEHVSTTKGDGLGFDILSFEENGRERLIEVKTTRLAEMTPFFVSRNELAVSEAREAEYHLYRLYRFDREPKLFVLHGALGATCRLDPQIYRAEVA